MKYSTAWSDIAATTLIFGIFTVLALGVIMGAGEL